MPKEYGEEEGTTTTLTRDRKKKAMILYVGLGCTRTI